jgi:hypothetical protein
VTAVRPPIFPPSQAAQPTRADAQRLAAQKAFFDVALGKSAGPAQARVAAAPNPARTGSGAAQRVPEAGVEKPQKILRPGSLLDIRV